MTDTPRSIFVGACYIYHNSVEAGVVVDMDRYSLVRLSGISV